MLDHTALSRALGNLGLGDWYVEVEPLIRTRLSDKGHGDFSGWRLALRSLRDRADAGESANREALLALAPWRKGPFDVGGIHIDSEWRSNLKWDRLTGAIASLEGRNVLDVGSGNGYYALRMREAGANCVIGIDPTILYAMQFLAVQCFARVERAFVLPLRSDELPPASHAFDTTFSMGVLYHQRSPIDHLRQLRQTLRSGGELVLETLFVPGEESHVCTPSGRYARMRNVWLLPTIAELTTWLKRTGFRDLNVVDRSVTSTEEQRTTEWMPYESLAEALDPDKSGWTIEGWPAPRRVIVLAKAP